MVVQVYKYLKQLLPKKVIMTDQNLKKLEIFYNKKLKKLKK